MAIVTVRRKPTYSELEVKVKELQDALIIAEKNRSLRDAGWDMLHKRIAELERQNRSLDVDMTTTHDKMTELVIKANAERDAARSEAEDIHLELMERDCRVDELKKQTEWLRSKNEEWAQVANNQKNIIEDLQKEVERWKRIASENIDMAKQFHHEALVAEEEVKRICANLEDVVATATSHICSNTVAN